jgi:hypothetical protein
MKRQTIIIIVIIAFVLIIGYFTFLKLRPMIAFKIAIQKASKFYSKEILSNVEKIYRLESANFTSGQFLGTWSPGMEKAKDVYPYGWTSLRPYWDANPLVKPVGLKTFTENGTGIKKTFIKFPTLNAGVFTLCKWLQNNGNKPAKWFSTNTASMANYQKKLDNINSSITNEIFT